MTFDPLKEAGDALRLRFVSRCLFCPVVLLFFDISLCFLEAFIIIRLQILCGCHVSVFMCEMLQQFAGQGPN